MLKNNSSKGGPERQLYLKIMPKFQLSDLQTFKKLLIFCVCSLSENMRPGPRELLLSGYTKSILNIEHKPIGLKDQDYLKISLC